MNLLRRTTPKFRKSLRDAFQTVIIVAIVNITLGGYFWTKWVIMAMLIYVVSAYFEMIGDHKDREQTKLLREGQTDFSELNRREIQHYKDSDFV